MRRSAIVMGVCLALAFACVAGGKIIYVDDNAAPGGDGQSWQTAYRYLQDALQEGQPLPSDPPAVNPPIQKTGVRSLRVRSVSGAAIASDLNEPIEIRVAQGLYRPDQGIRPKPGDRLATFQLTSGLALKGGYAGIGAMDPNARDRRVYETILSGDLTGNDIAVNDPCDLWREASRSENAYHVVTASGTDANTLLEGFTITAGNAYEYNFHPQAPNTHNSGGGLRNDDGSLWVRDCTFLRNVAEAYGGAMCNRDGASPHGVDCEFLEDVAREGGGVYNLKSQSIFENCVFRKDFAFVDGAGMVDDASTVDCRQCSFLENGGRSAGAVSRVWSSKGGLIECQFIRNYGSALLVADGCETTVQNCTFRQNQDVTRGAAIFASSARSLIVEGCSFTGNTTTTGGAIYITGTPYSPFADFVPVTVKNCTFNGNSAKDAGAIHSRISRVTVSNCTFSGNRAERGNAVLADHYDEYHKPGHTEISNCILWDGGNEIATLDDSRLSVNYCNVSGGLDGVIDPCSAVVWGMGNMESDPLFADANNADYHLKSQAGRYDAATGTWVIDDVTSPCVDAGNPASPIGSETFPNGGRINMGAYGGTPEASKSYFGDPVCETAVAGDINGDCRVDLIDLQIIGLHWLDEGGRTDMH